MIHCVMKIDAFLKKNHQKRQFLPSKEKRRVTIGHNSRPSHSFIIVRMARINTKAIEDVPVRLFLFSFLALSFSRLLIVNKHFDVMLKGFHLLEQVVVQRFSFELFIIKTQKVSMDSHARLQSMKSK